MKNQLITANEVGTNIQTGNTITVRSRNYTVTGIASRKNEGGGGVFELPKMFINVITNNERGEQVIFAAAELVRVKAVILTKAKNLITGSRHEFNNPSECLQAIGY